LTNGIAGNVLAVLYLITERKLPVQA